MYHLLLALAAFCATCVSAQPLTPDTGVSMIPPGLDNFGRFADGTVWSSPVGAALPQKRCSTNAECLKRGLPPLRPRGSRTRSALAPRTSQSVPIQYVGYLALYDTSDNFLGYLGPQGIDEGGYYGSAQPTTDGALLIHFRAQSMGTTEEIGVAIDSSTRTDNYKWLSITLGFLSTDDDMNTNSFDNGFLTASETADAKGAIASSGTSSFGDNYKDSETAVFIYDADTGAFSSEWIDTNGNPVYTSWIYSADENAINTSADPNYFITGYDSSYQVITMKFVDK